MRCAEVNCTTLRAADGENIAFESVQKALGQFESLWIQCSCLDKVSGPHGGRRHTNDLLIWP